MLKVGTQVVKTLFIQCAMAYVAIEDPGPCLISQPTETDAETFSKERLTKMVRDIPGLRAIISDPKSRSTANTVLYKEFPGGSWSLVGAGAAGNAARRSIRYAFHDEIDKYETTKEGTFTELAERRTATFGDRAKRIYCCSPTKPDSPIDRKYQQSDQREPYCGCWSCGEFQRLKWAQVWWDKTLPVEDQPASSRYICEHCGIHWNDAQRWKSAASDPIEWRPSKPFRGTLGFGALGHLYSPNYRLSQMVQKWIAVTANTSAEALEDLRAFINTDLAEDWTEKGDAPEWQRLYERSRQSYPQGMVPDGGLFITAGADVQKDRIEIYPYAWGRGKRSWCVDHVVLDGDTNRPEVWDRLTEFLSTTYQHEYGVDMRIEKFAIDSGYATQEVYAWARKQAPGRVMVVKGSDHGAGIVGVPTDVDIAHSGKRIKRGVKVWPLNVSALKSEFYGWLRLEKPTDEAFIAGMEYPPGYCHYPAFSEEVFRQLVAEQLVTRLVKGYPRSEWIKTRDRNEALDCRNYARAAASHAGLDRNAQRDVWWADLEAGLIDRAALQQRSKPMPEASIVAPVAAAPVIAAQRRESSGWIPRQQGWLNR